MKILFVHDYYQRFGGEDAAALAEKALLEKHAENVLLYTRDNNEIKGYSIAEKLASPFNAIYSTRTRREVVDIIREHRPDAAYIHNFFPLISPSLYHTLHASGVPSVQMAHDFRFMCPNGLFFTQGQICERCKEGTFLNAVRHRCYRDSYSASVVAASVIAINRRAGLLNKLSAFVCPTEFSKQKLIEVGVPEQKLFIKPHFIDASQIQPRFGQGNYVLYLGRLSAEKGLWTLVQTLAGMRDITLRIAGSGPLENHLRAYIREKELKHIEILGFKAGPEKWELLQNSLFLVVPSEWYETFGLVVLEAYSAGKPVIGSNLGGLPFVIENGKSGLLFQSGNSDDLREKILYLLEKPDEIETMGRYGRELVETKYHPEESYRTLRSVFSSVLSR
jgi:glycosyltransferase involved in cell wall biosynthesis